MKADSVHLWKIGLDLPDEFIAPSRRLLSESERARGDRLIREVHRKRFIATRASVRRILASYVGFEPDRLEFEANRFGKPALSSPGDAGIQFNLTHSKDQALLAVARGRRLGVDLEIIRPLSEMDGICRRFFSPEDRESVERAPDEQKLDAFYRVWTRMEALGKAVGTGIAIPLMPRPFGGEEGLHTLEDPSTEASTKDDPWSLVQFELDSGAAVALVVEGNGWELRGFRFDEFEASRASTLI